MVVKTFTLSSRFEASSETVIDLVKRPDTLFYVASPLVVFKPVSEATLPQYWQEGTYWMRLYLVGFLPMGRQAVVISYPSSRPFRMLDDGRSYLIKKWHHLIEVEADGHGTIYRDHLEIDAGWLTPAVLAFAKVFYRHRQSRWQDYLEQQAME
ncbi:hypothetical protein ACVR1G_08630 [Streptococcus dentasini]